MKIERVATAAVDLNVFRGRSKSLDCDCELGWKFGLRGTDENHHFVVTAFE